jgi:hypothetical protein
MKKFSASALLISAIAVFLGIAALAQAQSQFACNPGPGSLSSNDHEYPANQLILICKPTNWNGDLIVYAHGYVPVQKPLVLPIEELTLADGTFVPEIFVTQGFAFATSSYHKNGAATEQARQDLLSLVRYFESSVEPGALKRILIIGASEGGMVALQLIEQNSNQFDAGLALCAPTAGGPNQIKYASDFRVVFDYFFPDVFPFGAFNVPVEAFRDWETFMCRGLSRQ